MIVSCENCHTRFKIDDKRVRPVGVKLRCSKCQHTFELKPLSPADAVPEASGSPAPSPAPGTPPPDEAIIVAHPETAPAGLLRVEEIDRAVDAALCMPEGPVAAEMNLSEGGDRSGRAEDLFGAPGDVDADGQPPDPSLADAPAPSHPRERSEDFDWDHLSFSESRPASVDEALKATEEAESPAKSEPLELDTDRPKGAAGQRAFATISRETRSERGPKAEAELELARPVPPRGGPSQGSGQSFQSRPSLREEPPPQSRPSLREEPPAAGDAHGLAGRSRAQGDDKRGKRSEPAARSAKRSATLAAPSLSLPSPMVARPKRPPLHLPLVPTLAGSIAVGLLVALVSALSLYAPDGPLARTPAVLRPGGETGGRVELHLDDLSGRPVGRQDAEPLYVVTGRAHWSAPPTGGNWYLDGVLVDRRGRALQRRRARVGSLSALPSLLEASPGRPDPGTPLRAKGESDFLILFSPRPAWTADVRLEVRRAD